MPMQSYSFSIVALGLTLGSVSAIGAPKNAKCTHQKNEMIFQTLIPGKKISDVIKFLRINSIQFSAFSSDEQKVDLSELTESDFSAPLVSSLIASSKFPRKNWSIIEKTELLIMDFDENSNLKTFGCETYFTGP